MQANLLAFVLLAQSFQALGAPADEPREAKGKSVDATFGSKDTVLADACYWCGWPCNGYYCCNPYARCGLYNGYCVCYYTG